MKRCTDRLVLGLVLECIILAASCQKKGVEPTVPSVAITYPTEGMSVCEILEITAEAEDTQGIQKVEFYVDGQRKATDTDPPYAYLWHTLSLPDSSTHRIHIRAYDAEGHAAASPVVSVTIRRCLHPPSPVVVEDPLVLNAFAMRLTWSRSTEELFQSYRIYQSPTEGVEEHSTLIAVIEDDSTTVYTVGGLTQNRTYFFRVYVYDVLGFSSGSNEVRGTTLNVSPGAVKLGPPEDVREDRMTLTWSASEDHDFSSYRLYVGTSPGVDTLSTLVAERKNRFQTSYTVRGLKSDTQYVFRIFVYDTGGKVTGSNEVGGKISGPEPVTLYAAVVTESSVRLQWSESVDEDFTGYRVYRWLSPGVSTLCTLVASKGDRGSTTYTDTTVSPQTRYFYRVYVYDTNRLWAGSNEIEAATPSATPQPVTLSIPYYSTHQMISLSWSENHNEEFAFYRVFRSRTPGVDTLSTQVAEITQREQTLYMDTGLDPGTAYYYRIFVYDTDGRSVGSNEVRGSTLGIDVRLGMVLIPGGSFQMGNPFGDGNENEVPVHQVYVDAFYMDAYELTNVQYKAFVEATGHIPPVRGDRWYRSVPESYFAESPAYPVAAVTWLDAIQYCNWRSRQEGLEICYDEDTWGECDFSKGGYRLPTEAEWEYAARGGLEGKRYPWGDEDPFGRANYGGLDSSGEYLPEMFPFSYETSRRGPTPVGTYAPNGYGLYDMVGNVGEWCHDWYDEEYYSQSPDVNPTGPATYSGSASADRVHRGGDWWGEAFGCSGRSHADLRAHSAFRGFRCVRRAEY